jgi:hypothetical protein
VLPGQFSSRKDGISRISYLKKILLGMVLFVTLRSRDTVDIIGRTLYDPETIVKSYKGKATMSLAF